MNKGLFIEISALMTVNLIAKIVFKLEINTGGGGVYNKRYVYMLSIKGMYRPY